jgi:hypothetical protein
VVSRKAASSLLTRMPSVKWTDVIAGSSKILDLGLKLLTGHEADKDFGVFLTTHRHFQFRRTLTAPPLLAFRLSSARQSNLSCYRVDPI